MDVLLNLAKELRNVFGKVAERQGKKLTLSNAQEN